MEGERGTVRGMRRVTLCVLLSLVLHSAAAWWLGRIEWEQIHGGKGVAEQREKRPARAVQIVREEEEPQPPEKKEMVKTDPELEEKIPEEADFIGARNSVALASEFAPNRRSDAPVPTQNGDEDREELVTFNQARQTGDVEETQDSARPPQDAAAPPSPQAPQGEQREQEEPEPPERTGAQAIRLPQQGDDGDALLEEEELREVGQLRGEQIPIIIQPEVQTEPQRIPSKQVRMPIYDPSLAAHMQQGRAFRTYERRTRSTGRFVIGSRPALNVASTPLGRYEQEIYRRIAYFWYLACDDHLGDIVPGSVVVAIRINKGGGLENMDLVKRTGAGVIQQSFTFGAIRKAALPPMPDVVRHEVTGDVLELIFTFNFD